MMQQMEQYRQEVAQELKGILDYWQTRTLDLEQGGFVGRIDYRNHVYADAPKGSVLNSRILWTFSAAYNETGKEEYGELAYRAFRYLADHFMDKEYGGVYWTVDHTGAPLDTKKQIYALSFAVYGLSEYYRGSQSEEAKRLAIELYVAIEKHSYDPQYGGYIEALARDWKELEDLRLSAKDANEKKSMNTHLHVLEGFTNLYRIWPDEGLKQRLIELIHLFLDHIIDPDTNHLILFFDEAWKAKSGIVSYGHDIEAAWLLQEAAEVVGDEALLGQVKERSVKIAAAAAKGLDKDGGLWYEWDGAEQHLVKEKHWWPQGEAMVGFFNAWQNTGDEAFLKASLDSWRFTKEHLIDKQNGEWFWGVKEDYSIMNEDKVGLWKCPYHNSRACLEIMRRIHTN
ncbi:MAG TPA: AGE family epimerase/isomerase [Chitinophagaceae bacterium]